MTDQPFLNEPPEGFEATCELRWIETDKPVDLMPAVLSYRFLPEEKCHHFDAPVYVLCQKWTGAFRDCWVRIPIETP